MPIESPNIVAAIDEISAAIAAINPDIEGLEDLARVSISADLLTSVQTELSYYTRRRELCQRALAALIALASDGFPDLAKRVLPWALFEELKTTLEGIASSSGKFTKVPPATVIKGGLGNPVDK